MDPLGLFVRVRGGVPLAVGDGRVKDLVWRCEHEGVGLPVVEGVGERVVEQEALPDREVVRVGGAVGGEGVALRLRLRLPVKD